MARVEADTDRETVLSDWDEAVITDPAYPHPSSKSLTIDGILEDEYEEVNGYETTRPMFRCNLADIEDIDTIRGANIHIVGAETVLYKVRGHRVDGHGFAFLKLEEQ